MGVLNEKRCKTDLLVNKDGKIVSKSKSIDCIANNRLDAVNQIKRDRKTTPTTLL
jgi:hypothetical protein